MSPQGVLAGKVAIVTGGARGIGRGIALALGAEGATVAVADIRDATPVVDEIERRGGRATSDRCDIRDSGAVDAFRPFRMPRPSRPSAPSTSW